MWRDPFVQYVLKHPLFSRLQRISQHGTMMPYAYSRQTHSLGTAQTALDIMEVLKVEPTYRRCVFVAAVLHDVGHVGGSHFFDQFILPRLRRLHWMDHEDRSVVIANVLFNMYTGDQPMSMQEQQWVVDCIKDKERSTLPLYLRQIVNNKRSERLDADRIDYLDRDSVVFGYTGFDRDVVTSGAYIDKNLNLRFPMESALSTLRARIYAEKFQEMGFMERCQKTAAAMSDEQLLKITALTFSKWESIDDALLIQTILNNK